MTTLTYFFFFFNDTATTEIYTLSLHDALPIFIHLKDMKSPGESALFLDMGKGYLILGDALIGRPAGQLNLLPADRFADVTKARESLKRLLKYNFDAVLVGDGAAILAGAKEAVRRAILSLSLPPSSS